MGSHSDAEGDRYFSAMQRQALAVLAFWGKWMDEPDQQGVQIMEIRVQGPRKTGGEVRLVIKAVTEDGRPLVAFGNGVDFQSALADARTRNGMVGLKWKDDPPWEPK